MQDDPHPVAGEDNGASPARLLFIVNVDWFFISHRLPIAIAAIRAGFEVHVACALTGRQRQLETAGVKVHALPIQRGQGGWKSEYSALRAIFSLIRDVKPDIVHLITIKPVLLGGVAARILRVPQVVAAISGMGYTFIAEGLVARLRRAAITIFYRFALGHSNVQIIVQNPDDELMLTNLAGVEHDQIKRIRGSGVDLRVFSPKPMPSTDAVIVFAARLLVDKGIREFIDAARICKETGLSARFIVAGDLDPDNPAAVSQEQVQLWQSEGLAEFIGFQADIAALFANAHVVVLPSYREGLPKVLIEAAACARAVITTDVPGCRDAVEPDRSALLVPAKQTLPLATAIRRLVEDRALCERMGREGRRLAEAHFSIDSVVDAHLAIYSPARDTGI